jgi:branched-chain amino acid transport system ATP-binding protein
MLRVEDLTLNFGGVKALRNISLTVPGGQVLGLIGPNGAGKTSLFNVLTRLYTPQQGRVLFQGHDLLSHPRRKLARLGLSRTFQNVALFSGLTVRDNLLVGGFSRSRGGFWACTARLPAACARERESGRAADELLELFELSHLADEPVSGLPFGTAKRVELARALMARPTLLLLDEPAAGLTHGEVDELVQLIRTLRDELTLTLVIVEHHMRFVMSLSDRVIAFNSGTIMAEGAPEEVGSDPVVVEAYLGRPHEDRT